MTSAANARHARPRARTLRRAGGRGVAVLGFAALTWAAFTGTAMALDGVEQPANQTSRPAPGQTAAAASPGTHATKPGIPLGSLTEHAVRGLTDAAGALTSNTAASEAVSEAVSQDQPPPAVEPAETTTAQDGTTPARSSGSAGLLDSTVHGLTTYAVPQSSTTQQADNPTTATRPAPPQAPTGELSILGLAGGAESAVNDLGGSVLTATQLDQALPAPRVEVLTDTLEALAVTDALPTVPLPQLPVIGEPVGDVLGTLPADVTSGVEPALEDLTGGLLSPLPVLDPGASAPIQTSPATVLPQSDPIMSGALPVLPILLPIEAFPGVGSTDSPATFASLADGGTGVVQNDVYLSRALLDTSDAGAGDSSVPLPSGPSSPAGGSDGGSGSSHQQGGQLSSFTLPGGGLVSLVRDYRWHLPATPTFDPGFSPD